MSASEKLRRLEWPAVDDPDFDAKYTQAHAMRQKYDAALPALIAVVEAAERVDVRYGGESYEKAEDLEAALSSLNKALGEEA